jgi:hypothetical protein
MGEPNHRIPMRGILPYGCASPVHGALRRTRAARSPSMTRRTVVSSLWLSSSLMAYPLAAPDSNTLPGFAHPAQWRCIPQLGMRW